MPIKALTPNQKPGFEQNPVSTIRLFDTTSEFKTSVIVIASAAKQSQRLWFQTKDL
jgi:hypothetical protein